MYLQSTHRQQEDIDYMPAQNSDNFQKIEAKLQYFLLIKQQKFAQRLGALPPNPRYFHWKVTCNPITYIKLLRV